MIYETDDYIKLLPFVLCWNFSLFSPYIAEPSGHPVIIDANVTFTDDGKYRDVGLTWTVIKPHRSRIVGRTVILSYLNLDLDFYNFSLGG